LQTPILALQVLQQKLAFNADFFTKGTFIIFGTRESFLYFRGSFIIFISLKEVLLFYYLFFAKKN